MADAVRDTIRAIRTLLLEQRDGALLAEQIPPALEVLRGLYKADRSAFRPQDVRFLKHAAQAAEAAEDFCSLLPDIPGVRVHSDAAAYLDALAELHATLHDAAIGRRVRREIRALRERFPGAAVEAAAAARQHRLRALEARAWPCRCGEAMTLRPGRADDWFWGCARYPRCTYSHQLTDKQRAFIEGGG
jgi:hypothetical protein